MAVCLSKVLFMKISVHFLGILSDYFKTPKCQLELPSGATQKDLLRALGDRFGRQLPGRLWNHAQDRFVVGVHIAGKNGDLDQPDMPLCDEDEINILLPIAGGHSGGIFGKGINYRWGRQFRTEPE